jgi:hypothetical protein
MLATFKLTLSFSIKPWKLATFYNLKKGDMSKILRFGKKKGEMPPKLSICQPFLVWNILCSLCIIATSNSDLNYT